MQNTESVGIATQGATEGFWPKGWWSIVDFKIGIVPLPIYVALLGLITGFVLTGKVPSDILMGMVLLSMGGFTCAELGKRLPVVRHIGAAVGTLVGTLLGLGAHHTLFFIVVPIMAGGCLLYTSRCV